MGKTLSRIRESWAVDSKNTLAGSVDVNETFFGGELKNISKIKREETKIGVSVGKTTEVDVLDRSTKEFRAKIPKRANSTTQIGFVVQNATESATMYTDGFLSRD